MITVKNFFSRVLDSIVKPFFEVRPGERAKTLLMFFYFFLTIALVYILKPIRSSLFLEELGAQNLRYVYIGEGLFLFLVVAVYVQCAKRISRRVLYPSVLLFFIGNLIAFWGLFHFKLPFLSGLFYVWVASFTITMTTQFWTLANDIYNPMEAKRLFGLIISGGSLGGILGGLLTQQAVRWIETRDLLLVAGVILGFCSFLSWLLSQELPKDDTYGAPSSPGDPRNQMHLAQGMTGSVVKTFLSSRYLLMLAGLVIIAKMSSTIVDNQFNKMVELSVVGSDERTAFFGGFMAALNTLSFVMQFFLTGFCLRYIGVGTSLWILPLGFAFASSVSFLQPVLMTALCLKLFDGSISYSIQQASKEVLFVPLPSDLRYRVKPIIDMLGFRAAKSLAGIYIVIAAPLLGIADEKLGVLVLTLIPLWGILAWRMKGAYAGVLRDYLMRTIRGEKTKEPRRATDVLSTLHNEKAFEEIQSFMNHSSSYARKLAATASFMYSQSSRDLEFTRQAIQQIVDRETSQTKASELEAAPSQENVDLLLKTIRMTQDHALRFAVLKTLCRLTHEGGEWDFNRGLLKKEVKREGRILESIQKIERYYLHHYNDADETSEKNLHVAIRAMQDESMERLFCLLHLLYPRDGIQMIYENFVKYVDPGVEENHVVELLANILSPDLLIQMQHLLGRKDRMRVKELEVIEILKRFIGSADLWFTLTARFIVAELSLHDQLPELLSFQEYLQQMSPA